MKKSFLTLFVAAFFAGTIFTSCSSSAEKVEDAQEEVNESQEELNEANKEYLEEMERYRLEAAERTAQNQESIAEFEQRIAKQKADAREDYKKRIAELNQKNTDLKKQMEDYKDSGKENWEVFKKQYNHSMDELALKLLELNDIK